LFLDKSSVASLLLSQSRNVNAVVFLLTSKGNSKLLLHDDRGFCDRNYDIKIKVKE